MPEFTANEQVMQYIKAFGIAAGFFGIGYIFEKVLLGRLKTLAEKTAWAGDDIIIEALNKWVTYIILLIGIYLAVLYLPFAEKTETLINKVLLVLAILFGTIILSKISVGFVGIYTKKVGGQLPSTSIFSNIAKILIFCMGGLVILQSLGISITPILTALGVGGLAVALALQDTLSNLFSGVQVLASGQIKPGNYIKIDNGVEGYVVDITWRNTTLRAMQNNMVVIPNSKIAQSIITNFDGPTKIMSLIIPFSVVYGADLEKVKKAVVETGEYVMKNLIGGVPDHETVLRMTAMGNYGLEFVAVLKVNEFAEQYAIKHEYLERLYLRFVKEGIEIPYPTQTILLKKD